MPAPRRRSSRRSSWRQSRPGSRRGSIIPASSTTCSFAIQTGQKDRQILLPKESALASRAEGREDVFRGRETTRLKLDVQTVLPIHGRMVKVNELRVEAGAQ